MAKISELILGLQELVAYPREDLGIECKGWLKLRDKVDGTLHCADLAHALLAMANHGGGYILIGFQKSTDGTISEAPDRPANLLDFDQDHINGIVQKYADPPFHVDLRIVDHPDSAVRFPVLIVPGGATVPIRALRDGPYQKHVLQHRYYIRRLGPQSDEPKTAQEWQQLINRCLLASRDRLIDDFRQILSGQPSAAVAAPSVQEKLRIWDDSSHARFSELVQQHLSKEQPSRYAGGTWTAAYVIEDSNLRPSIPELKRLLESVRGDTGWRPWWVPTRPAIGLFQKSVKQL